MPDMSDMYDDLEGEDVEADEPEDDEESDEAVATPKMVVFVFVAADDGKLSEVIEAVADDGEKRGMWLVHASESPMRMDEVPHGSELWQAVTGRNA